MGRYSKTSGAARVATAPTAACAAAFGVTAPTANKYRCSGENRARIPIGMGFRHGYRELGDSVLLGMLWNIAAQHLVGALADRHSFVTFRKNAHSAFLGGFRDNVSPFEVVDINIL